MVACLAVGALWNHLLLSESLAIRVGVFRGFLTSPRMLVLAALTFLFLTLGVAARLKPGRTLVQAGLISVGVSIVYFAVKAPETQNGGDNLLYVPSAMSLIEEGNLDVNEYEGWFRDDKRRFEGKAIAISGRMYNVFPIGTSLTIVPVVFAANAVIPGHPRSQLKSFAVALLAAKLIAALSVGLMFMALCELTDNRTLAVLLALLFAFGTSQFSCHAGGLWSHNSTAFVFALSLYLILEGNGRLTWLAGIPVGLGYLCRPDFSVVLLLLSAYVLTHRRPHTWRFAALLGTVLVAFSAWSVSVYGSWLPPYYLPGRLGSHAFWEALAGNLISPNRGLLVLTPAAVFSFLGVGVAFFRQGLHPLYRYLGLALLLHWLVISSFSHWWAGHSYGPRLFSSMLPAIVLLIVPALSFLSALPGKRRLALVSLFWVCAAIGLFVHTVGAVSVRAQSWNARPKNVDRHPERVWDWRDWQPLSGIR